MLTLFTSTISNHGMLSWCAQITWTFPAPYHTWLVWGGKHSLKISASSYRFWFMILWRYGGKGWLSDLMNDKAVYRTALATPGLLIIFSSLLCSIQYFCTIYKAKKKMFWFSVLSAYIYIYTYLYTHIYLKITISFRFLINYRIFLK